MKIYRTTRSLAHRAFLFMKYTLRPSLRKKPPSEERKGEVVFLLHGILRRAGAMRPIEDSLRKKGYRVVNFGYRSRSESIGDIADSLADRVKRLMEEEPVTGISFVTHSMGSIVVRYCLAHYREIPVKRFIMIAPPNRGSIMASYLKRWLPYRLILGRAVEELARSSESLVSRLPEPRGEFGVIAGGTGASTGMNPFIPGDDDGTVSVEETRLSGMTDFIQVRGQHSTLLFQRRVIANVFSFLEDGRFLHDN